MTPETASASRPDLNLDSLRVYFLYEDHIGRPVLMSEYEDYDSDGSYFTDDNANDYPYFHATYDPFGSINEDFDSTGIVVGNNNDTKITWSVPFRFPGQYQDPELEGVIFYNWNRYYSPAIGRYNRADPLAFLPVHPKIWLSVSTINQLDALAIAYFLNHAVRAYQYSMNSPLIYTDFSGLIEMCTICIKGNYELTVDIDCSLDEDALKKGKIKFKKVKVECKIKKKKCKRKIKFPLLDQIKNSTNSLKKSFGSKPLPVPPTE